MAGPATAMMTFFHHTWDRNSSGASARSGDSGVSPAIFT